MNYSQFAISAASQLATKLGVKQTEVEIIQDAIDTSTAALRAEVERLKWHNDGVKKEYSELVKEKEQLRSDLATAQQERDEADADAVKFSSEIGALHLQLDDLQAQLAKAESAGAEMRELVNAYAYNNRAWCRECHRAFGTGHDPHCKLGMAISSDCGKDYIRKSDADAQTREAVRPLEDAMYKACDQLKRGEWNSFNSGTWQILHDALDAHARKQGWCE